MSTLARTLRVPYTDFPAQFSTQQEELLEAVTRVLTRGDFILGQEVAAFEQACATRCGVKHAIGVASGTDALILAMKALEIGPGDEVITPPNSWISSTSSIIHVGAKPVFADVTEDFTIDPEQVERVMTPRTKAIIPVHLTGRCADMDAITSIARRHQVVVIEDAAQAMGARLYDTPAGSFGDLGCFSLHPLKNLSGIGDGGVITTDNDAHAHQLRLLRNHGLEHRDEVVCWGYNSRLDTIQAAVLLARLNQLDPVIERRRRYASWYRDALGSIVTCPRPEVPGERAVYHLFMIQCERRHALQQFLAERGVETKVHYPIPIHLQPCSQALGYRPGDLPVAERQAERILSLPIHQHLTGEQINHVSETIREFYAHG